MDATFRFSLKVKYKFLDWTDLPNYVYGNLKSVIFLVFYINGFSI